MFHIRFKKKIYWKNLQITPFRSFPLFWWAMWVNCSFHSNQMSAVSKLLISLTKNEGPRAIRSGRSEEMSDLSESLISLTKNERMSESLIFLSESLICSFLDKKRAICLEIKWANSQPCCTHTTEPNQSVHWTACTVCRIGQNPPTAHTQQNTINQFTEVHVSYIV